LACRLLRPFLNLSSESKKVIRLNRIKTQQTSPGLIFNATNIGENLTGIGRYSLIIARYLLQHWQQPFTLYINAKAKKHFEEYASAGNIRVISGLTSPDLRFSGHLLRLLWTNKLSIGDRRTIIFNSSQLEASVFHSRQIITVHDLIPLIFPRYHLRQYHFLKHVLPHVLRKSLKVITVSQHTKELMMQHYGIDESKIVVIHNGVAFNIHPNEIQQAKQCLHEENHRHYILYVGRLSPTKNIERLIKAFDLFRHKYQIDCDLKLTGIRTSLNLKHLNISDSSQRHVQFLSNVSDPALKKLYLNARFLAFPSLYEGFGLPPLEAMAAGCPTLVSRVASLPEVCGDAAYYVDPYDVESIAEGFYQLFVNQTLRQSLIDKGLERVKNFCWEDSVKKHIEVLEQVIG